MENMDFFEAVTNGDLQTVQNILNDRGNFLVHAKDDYGIPILYYATGGGRLDVFLELIKRGANINEKIANGNTPLHMASINGNTEVVLELIYRGVNINEKDERGSTPLHHACNYGCLNVVQQLIRNGANINEKNNMGYTPLHVASSYGEFPEIVKELLLCGADYTIQNVFRLDGLSGLSDNDRKKLIEECFSMEIKEPSVE
jgi:ankyrin repeat protein